MQANKHVICIMIYFPIPKLQVFVFSLRAKNEDWKFYDWNKVTTVVMVGYFDIKLVCHAHKNGARAITIGMSTSLMSL